MNKIDLHMHSIISDDGEFPIQTLINKAKENNIEIIAIADHNSTKAHLENYDAKGIHVISAIELDCTFLGKDFHLLGYGIDPSAEIYKKIEEDILLQEQTATKHRLDYVKNIMKLKLDSSILEKRCRNGIIVAEALCEAAMACDENRNNSYLKEFYPGGKRSNNPQVNFFWDYFAKGKEGYFPTHYISMEEAIKIYRSQKAEIVLAHPGNNVKEDKQLLDDIIALEIDGLEVYSSYHTSEQIDFYHKACEKYGLLMTCGSDYHGRTKPNVQMGQCYMPLHEEENLYKYLKTNLIK